MKLHASRRWAALAVVTATVIGEPSAAGQSSERHSGNGGTGAVTWPNVQIRDSVTRDAATRALTAAANWLTDPQCERLFSEFADVKGAPLSQRLRELETKPDGYLQLVFFFDGAQHPTCQRHGILAFTAVGSRTVYLCGRDFERAWKKDPREVQATLIHEMLHSLGLGENPPSPRHITDRVQKLCWK